jgi:hypothetical protein
MTSRRSVGVPPPQVFDAARLIDAAFTSHLMGNRPLAEQLIRAADIPDIYRWLKPIWAELPPDSHATL